MLRQLLIILWLLLPVIGVVLQWVSKDAFNENSFVLGILFLLPVGIVIFFSMILGENPMELITALWRG